jgi:hypothetical protein
MAYDTKELTKEALKKIKKYKLTTIEDITIYLGISKQTFYGHKLNEIDDIKEAIRKNKQKIKMTLRERWLNSDNATLQVALYKILGTYEEYQRLSNSRQDINVGGQKDNPIHIVNFSDFLENNDKE